MIVWNGYFIELAIDNITEVIDLIMYVITSGWFRESVIIIINIWRWNKQLSLDFGESDGIMTLITNLVPMTNQDTLIIYHRIINTEPELSDDNNNNTDSIQTLPILDVSFKIKFI